jgi:hypothetical protein
MQNLIDTFSDSNVKQHKVLIEWIMLNVNGWKKNIEQAKNDITNQSKVKNFTWDMQQKMITDQMQNFNSINTTVFAYSTQIGEIYRAHYLSPDTLNSVRERCIHSAQKCLTMLANDIISDPMLAQMVNVVCARIKTFYNDVQIVCATNIGLMSKRCNHPCDVGHDNLAPHLRLDVCQDIRFEIDKMIEGNRIVTLCIDTLRSGGINNVTIPSLFFMTSILI